MKIINHLVNNSSKERIIIEYQDSNSFDTLPPMQCTQVLCFAFYQERLLLVHDMHKNRWGLAGGSIEKGESFENTAKRELREEANVKLLYSQAIGYQTVFIDKKEPEYQLRFYCEIEPYGEFINDPDGDIDAIKYIDLNEFQQYTNWGKIGEHLVKQVAKIRNNRKSQL